PDRFGPAASDKEFNEAIQVVPAFSGRGSETLPLIDHRSNAVVEAPPTQSLGGSQLDPQRRRLQLLTQERHRLIAFDSRKEIDQVTLDLDIVSVLDALGQCIQGGVRELLTELKRIIRSMGLCSLYIVDERLFLALRLNFLPP